MWMADVSTSRCLRRCGHTIWSPRRDGCAGRQALSGCRACWGRATVGCTPRGCPAGRRSTPIGWPIRGPRRVRSARVCGYCTTRLPRRRLPVRPAAVGDRFTADRPAGGLPRRRVRTQHVDRRRRPLLWARRPRRPRSRRSVGRPGGSDAVAVVELLRVVGRRAARRLRCGSGPGCASTTTGDCGTRATSRPAKLERDLASSRKGISAGHKRRACRFPDRHQGRKHPVRPVGQPGVLRVVVPVPRQQHAGLGRPRRLRLPVRLAPAHATTSTRRTCASTSTRTRSCCCPTIRCRTCNASSRSSGFHRFFETTDSVKHRVSGPKGDLDVMIIALRAPADGPIGDSGLVVDDGETVALQHERRAPRRPRRPATPISATSTCTCCSTRARSGTRWSTTCPLGPRRRSAPRSVSARWTAAASTSRRSARRGWSRRPARRASSTPNCVTSTTTTATRPTSSPTRWCSWTRCATHGHDRGLLMIPGSTRGFHWARS